MNTQSRISLTLSPRARKALELCAALDGSSPTTYATQLLTEAIFQNIERSTVLSEEWPRIEREVLEKGSWEETRFEVLEKLKRDITAPSQKGDKPLVKGWYLAGSHPQNYNYGIDPQVTFEGKNSAYLRSKERSAEGFGTLMQSFKAGTYKNTRLRFSATVRAEEVEGWAGLWMRIDDQVGQVLSFDNMGDRPITGSSNWQKYEVVLDTPAESESVNYGILLDGRGQIWISNIVIDTVSTDIPTTNVEDMLLNAPMNLDFTA